VAVVPAATAATPSQDAVITGTSSGGGGAFDMLWILALCAAVLVRPRQLLRGVCTVTHGAPAVRTVTVAKHAHVQQTQLEASDSDRSPVQRIARCNYAGVGADR
jgi:hypothetical protein